MGGVTGKKHSYDENGNWGGGERTYTNRLREKGTVGLVAELPGSVRNTLGLMCWQKRGGRVRGQKKERRQVTQPERATYRFRVGRGVPYEESQRLNLSNTDLTNEEGWKARKQKSNEKKQSGRGT